MEFDGAVEKVDNVNFAWEKFRNSGLLWFVNQLLHTFGYAIVYSFNDDNTIKSVYPARVKFRGFTKTSIENGHRNIANYMKENADQLYKETLE